jgi:hypothetical protein
VDQQRPPRLDPFGFDVEIRCEAGNRECTQIASWWSRCPRCGGIVFFCERHHAAWPDVVLDYVTVTHDEGGCTEPIPTVDIRWTRLR